MNIHILPERCWQRVKGIQGEKKLVSLHSNYRKNCERWLELASQVIPALLVKEDRDLRRAANDQQFEK